MDAAAKKNLGEISREFKGMSPHPAVFRHDPVYRPFAALRAALESVDAGIALTADGFHRATRDFVQAAKERDPFFPEKDPDTVTHEANKRFQAVKNIYFAIMRINQHLEELDIEDIQRNGSERDRNIVTHRLSAYNPPPQSLARPAMD